MRKVLRYFLMSLLALCFALPCLGSAEAATVAVLPLFNNVKGGDDLAGQVYYKEALAVLNANPGFVTVDNQKLTAAIEAAGITRVDKNLPTEGTLAKLCRDGDVDIVIAIQVDHLKEDYQSSSEEDKIILDIQGYAVAYNRLTGVMYRHRIYDDRALPAVFGSRWDLLHEEWGTNVRLEVDRIMNAKAK